MYDARAQVITDAIAKFGVMALPRQFNPQALGNVTPRYSWQIDPAKLNITGQEVMQKLADTRPIGIGSMGAGASGMRGREPGAAQGATQVPRRPAATRTRTRAVRRAIRTASASLSGSSKKAKTK